MSERQLQDHIIELAELMGFLIHHDRPAQYEDGNWATHIQGHIGFPDLILVHPRSHAIVVIECKSATGKATKNQHDWLFSFLEPQGLPERRGIWVCLFRPKHIQDGTVSDTLTKAAHWSNPPSV